MKPTRSLTVLLLLLSAATGGCRKKPRAVPTPNADSAVAAAAQRARADSISRAERSRMAEEQAERERLARERAAREGGAASPKDRNVLAEMIFFDYDSQDLTPEAQDALQRKAAVLRANPAIRLQIAGHADQRGSTEYNLALGQRRAEAVRAWFAGAGLDPSRFTTISYGKERPLVEGDNEEAWAQNRRAEFLVLRGNTGGAQ